MILVKKQKTKQVLRDSCFSNSLFPSKEILISLKYFIEGGGRGKEKNNRKFKFLF